MAVSAHPCAHCISASLHVNANKKIKGFVREQRETRKALKKCE